MTQLPVNPSGQRSVGVVSVLDVFWHVWHSTRHRCHNLHLTSYPRQAC